ncbi:DUF5336 domain-containing protein [Phaeacidiphilus oryzae]|uniref:DUF5336 domain-containing protein n=1 Tax=Phaeacidiphilus oryzae TaxID=348818 RepID=UPI00068E15E6|nr:DUF5336 domain-containing protein [Phaeacidiphilus oryzae]
MRSVTRGDALAALAGLLLLISSFLPFWTVDHCPAGATCSKNSWAAEFFPLLPSVVLAGLIGAALLVAARFLPKELRIAGLGVSQWGTALSATAAWAALWSLFGSMGEGVSGFSHGIGAYLEFLFAVVLTAAAVAAPRVSALEAPLMPAPKPVAAGGPAGMAPGAPGAPGGYGYQPQQSYAQGDPTPAGWASPAAAQPAGASASGGYPAPAGPGFGQPAGSAPQPAGAGGPQPAGAGGPDGAQAGGRASVPQPSAPQPSAPQPSASQPAEQPPAGQPAFAPFWFAVPAQRRLAPEDDPVGAPVGELNPGIWYLAVGERGGALIAQTQDGRRGLLTDTTGIQRG